MHILHTKICERNKERNMKLTSPPKLSPCVTQRLTDRSSLFNTLTSMNTARPGTGRPPPTARPPGGSMVSHTIIAKRNTHS